MDEHIKQSQDIVVDLIRHTSLVHMAVLILQVLLEYRAYLGEYSPIIAIISTIPWVFCNICNKSVIAGYNT